MGMQSIHNWLKWFLYRILHKEPRYLHMTYIDIFVILGMNMSFYRSITFFFKKDNSGTTITPYEICIIF